MPAVYCGLADGLHGLVGVLQGFTWSRAQLLDYQSRRLRPIVLHAYRRVPRYRRLFDEAGLKPADIRGLEDLSRIPNFPARGFSTGART